MTGVQLILSNENKKLEYYKKCKILVNQITNRLIVKPIHNGPKIVVLLDFERSFIKYKNVLCVVDAEINNAVIIFTSENTCNTIYDVVQKDKDTVEVDPIKACIFQRKFILLLFVETLSKTGRDLEEIKMLIFDIMNSLDEVEKRDFMNILEILDKKVFILSSKNETHWTKSIDAEKFKLISYKSCGKLERKLLIYSSTDKSQCYEFGEDEKEADTFLCSNCKFEKCDIPAKLCQNENGTNYVQLKSLEHRCQPMKFDVERYQDDSIFYEPNFEILQQNGKVTALLIFSFPDQPRRCEKFAYFKDGNYFYCRKCSSQNHQIRAYLCKNANSENYISVRNLKHICDSSEFNFVKPEGYQLLKRKSRGKILDHLVIFDEKNKKLCHELTWTQSANVFRCNSCLYKHKHYVCAKFVENNEGKKLVNIGHYQHKCDLQKYVPEDRPISFWLKRPRRKCNENGPKNYV